MLFSHCSKSTNISNPDENKIAEVLASGVGHSYLFIWIGCGSAKSSK
jgi:hypothetical protein